jgi:hypothetical protein
MELRRILLRVLLAALGLAAVMGVLGVITAAGDTIWRIVWTAITTAVAVAIMLPCSRMMDKEKTRAGGLGGLVWTVVGYLLVVALIWSLGFWRGGSWEESVGMTLVAWICCGLPAVFLLNIAGVPDARVAGRTGVAIAAGSFLLLLVWAWGRTFLSWSVRDQWWESGLALGGLGVVVVANLVRVGTSDRRWWRWLGVAALVVAWLLAEAGICLQTSSPFGRQVLTLLISIGAVLGLANLVLTVPLVGQQELVRWGTLAAAAVCAGAINMLVFEDFGYMSEIWGRAAAGSGIVTGCGSLALLVLARINRRVEFRPDESAVLASDVAIVCPRCSKSQRIALGGASCGACGLRIEITIEEPRCPQCGYLLYKLASPICPECGTALASQAPSANPPTTT